MSGTANHVEFSHQDVDSQHISVAGRDIVTVLGVAADALNENVASMGVVVFLVLTFLSPLQLPVYVGWEVLSRKFNVNRIWLLASTVLAGLILFYPLLSGGDISLLSATLRDWWNGFVSRDVALINVFVWIANLFGRLLSAAAQISYRPTDLTVDSYALHLTSLTRPLPFPDYMFSGWPLSVFLSLVVATVYDFQTYKRGTKSQGQQFGSTVDNRQYDRRSGPTGGQHWQRVAAVVVLLAAVGAFGWIYSPTTMRLAGQSIIARVENWIGFATSTQNLPTCDPDKPTFVLGFAELRQAVGDAMGDAVGCEVAQGDGGNTTQATNRGEAFYDSATNTAMFTDGWRHWALTDAGLVYWEGTEARPPAR